MTCLLSSTMELSLKLVYCVNKMCLKYEKKILQIITYFFWY